MQSGSYVHYDAFVSFDLPIVSFGSLGCDDIVVEIVVIREWPSFASSPMPWCDEESSLHASQPGDVAIN